MSNWMEWLGYVASGFVIGSFLVKNNIRLLRAINLIGALLFTIYSINVGKIPLIIPNVFVAMIQIYYLYIKKEDS